MIYCITLLLIVTTWSLLTYRQGGPIFYLPIFFILVCFAGFRGPRVGTDTYGYVKSFESTEGMSNVKGKLVEESMNEEITVKSLFSETGYVLLNVIAKWISSHYAALFCLVAAVVVGSYLKSFQLYSVNAAVSLFILMTMAWYFFFFNGARQGLAAAVYTLSFGALTDRNFKKYCLWVFVAMMFHRSIFFAIPLYFLFTRPNNFKQNLLIILIGIFCILFLKDLIRIAADLTSEKYRGYIESENSGGKLYTLFYVLQGIGFLYVKRFISLEERPKYDVFLNMLLFGAIIYVVVVCGNLTQNLMRFSFYFTIGACYTWPLVFKNLQVSMSENQELLKNPHGTGIVFLIKLALIFGNLSYFYLVIPKTSAMSNYCFNELITDLFQK